jgi:hypothetical protein
MVQGARFLNDNGHLLGLNIYDLIGAVGVLVIASELLRPVGLEFLGVPAGIGAMVALIPIRLRYRRRIIRDTIGFLVGARIVHERKHHAPRG